MWNAGKPNWFWSIDVFFRLPSIKCSSNRTVLNTLPVSVQFARRRQHRGAEHVACVRFFARRQHRGVELVGGADTLYSGTERCWTRWLRNMSRLCFPISVRPVSEKGFSVGTKHTLFDEKTELPVPRIEWGRWQGFFVGTKHTLSDEKTDRSNVNDYWFVRDTTVSSFSLNQESVRRHWDFKVDTCHYSAVLNSTARYYCD